VTITRAPSRALRSHRVFDDSPRSAGSERDELGQHLGVRQREVVRPQPQPRKPETESHVAQRPLGPALGGTARPGPTREREPFASPRSNARLAQAPALDRRAERIGRCGRPVPAPRIALEQPRPRSAARPPPASTKGRSRTSVRARPAPRPAPGSPPGRPGTGREPGSSA
jgi:hypothetical protein